MSESKTGLAAISEINRFIEKNGQNPSKVILETQGFFSGYKFLEIHAPHIEVTLELLSVSVKIEGTALIQGVERLVNETCEIWHLKLGVDSSDNQLLITDDSTTLTIIK